MADRQRVSVSLITFNEESNVRACLESAKWADEIVVVDSFSTDATQAIAREYTDRVIEREWRGINDQRQFALEQCSGPWVLCIDADERVTPELRDEILAVLSGPDPDCAGFLIPRKAWYLGRWIKHCGWYPDYKPRLFRKDKGRFGENDPHDKIILDGATRKLKGDLLHFTYRDLAHNADTINRFTTTRAKKFLREGRTAGFLDFTLHPLWRFFHQYVLRGGFLDGMPGLIISGMSAFNVFLRQAKVWEGTHATGEERPE